MQAFGIPEWMAHVEDRLFEGMSQEKAMTWRPDFLSAIQPGVELEKVKALFLVAVLQSALTTFDHEKFPDVRSAIEGSISLWQRTDIKSDDWNDAAWAARAAAWAAGKDAAEAAWSSARVAREAWAAWAAWAAEVEDAVENAAEAAARPAEKYDHFADELLKILRDRGLEHQANAAIDQLEREANSRG